MDGGIPAPASRPLRVAIVAGEQSGDQLGFKLMRALREEAGRPVDFVGVGGPRMEAEGLRSAFPLSDIAVMGIVPVIKILPLLLRRIREAADGIIAAEPDLVMIVDSPDFTHRVAKRIRRARPLVPIVDYVSPSVWAWRSGRAPRMRAYVDHVLALLPFEPEAHRRLGGPPCSYVGHPLVERLGEFRPSEADQARRDADPPLVVVLPGSRRSEIERLGDDFGAALKLLSDRVGAIDLVLPAVDHWAELIRQKTDQWPIRPRIVRGESAKLAAFRQARVALAASGTVTLELALAQVPMVVAYRVSPFETWLRYVVKVPSIVLPNLVLGERAVPELVQEVCTPERLADALAPLVGDTAERHRQSDALRRVGNAIRLDEGDDPSRRAARIALSTRVLTTSQP